MKFLRVLPMLVVLFLAPLSWAKEPDPALEFRASDKSFTLSTQEDFRVTFNPYAVLSLASLDEVAVVVTKRKAESKVEQIYESYVKSLPANYPCRGRMMIGLDGEQAAAFVIDGMFPPQGEITHQTLLAIAVRDGQEYNFMVHYPIENEELGLEQAYALLGTVKWSPVEATKS